MDITSSKYNTFLRLTETGLTKKELKRHMSIDDLTYEKLRDRIVAYGSGGLRSEFDERLEMARLSEKRAVEMALYMADKTRKGKLTSKFLRKEIDELVIIMELYPAYPIR